MGASQIGGGAGLTNNATDALGLTNHAGDAAIQAQTNATNNANATMLQMYNQQRSDLQPFRDQGLAANSQLSDNTFMNNWQQDPGYQFRMNEGNKAINASAAARGMANSGATMKALTQYGQDYATNEYNNVYNRNYQRLSGLAGLGAGANQSQVQAAGQYGQGMAQNQIGLGNAQASNDIAGVNRMSQMMGQGAGAAAMAFSDERLKTNIDKISQDEISEMKKHLTAYKFNYKSAEHGQGDWVGVMAQDLEKSKLGRTLVVEDESGNKMIDLKKVLSMYLATMAEG